MTRVFQNIFLRHTRRLSQFSEAAEMYEKAGQFEKAASIYIQVMSAVIDVCIHHLQLPDDDKHPSCIFAYCIFSIVRQPFKVIHRCLYPRNPGTRTHQSLLACVTQLCLCGCTCRPRTLLLQHPSCPRSPRLSCSCSSQKQRKLKAGKCDFADFYRRHIVFTTIAHVV
jgi:hypothetical protein